MKGLTPQPYGDFAQSYFQRMQNYPTPYSTEQDIVDAVFAAVTDDGNQLCFPAGPDTKLLSKLRWSTSEQNYLAGCKKCSAPVCTRWDTSGWPTVGELTRTEGAN